MDIHPGSDWEWVVILMDYEDGDTWGVSQPMPRLAAKVNCDGLAKGRLVDGKRVSRAQLITLNPQPTVVLDGGLA